MSDLINYNINKDLSPAKNEGIIKIKVRISIPPKRQEGGKIRILYSPQRQGFV